MRLACTLLLPLLKGSADTAEAKVKPAALGERERAAAEPLATLQNDAPRAMSEAAPVSGTAAPLVASPTSATSTKACLPTARLRLPAQCATMAPMRRRRRVRTG
jgi:hypothetical protein